MDVGIPLHDLTFGHGDDDKEKIEKGDFEDVYKKERSLLSVVGKLRR